MASVLYAERPRGADAAAGFPGATPRVQTPADWPPPPPIANDAAEAEVVDVAADVGT